MVWVTLLLLKNSEGNVFGSMIGLAHEARVTPDECREALAFLMAPDPDDTSKVDDGIRVREIPGGWKIVNHDLHRFTTESKREMWRLDKASQRERLAKKKAQRRPKSVKVADVASEPVKAPTADEKQENDAWFRREAERGLADLNDHIDHGTMMP